MLCLQGGIDEDEDPKNAAIRELREETGVTSVEVLAEVGFIVCLTEVVSTHVMLLEVFVNTSNTHGKCKELSFHFWEKE